MGQIFVNRHVFGTHATDVCIGVFSGDEFSSYAGLFDVTSRSAGRQRPRLPLGSPGQWIELERQ